MLITLVIFGATFAVKPTAQAGTTGFPQMTTPSYPSEKGYGYIYFNETKLGTPAQVIKQVNDAAPRNESNPSQNTGFNVDSTGNYWYKNYDSNETKSQTLYAVNQLDLSKNQPVDDLKSNPNYKKIEKEASLVRKYRKQLKQLKKNRASNKQIQKVTQQLTRAQKALTDLQ
ncbi:hypothetical protein HZL42_06940 [Lactobacillus sp. Sy-1]|nr:hypothetical protein [Lactobacillus sp. Sy-1]